MRALAASHPQRRNCGCYATLVADELFHRALFTLHQYALPMSGDVPNLQVLTSFLSAPCISASALCCAAAFRLLLLPQRLLLLLSLPLRLLYYYDYYCYCYYYRYYRYYYYYYHHYYHYHYY